MRHDARLNDDLARYLYGHYLGEVKALTQVYLLRAPDDDQWLRAIRGSARAAQSSPGKPAGRALLLSPCLVLLGVIAALLVAGVSAGIYFAAASATIVPAATFLEPGSGRVSSAAFNPDGTTFAAAYENGRTYQWDVR